MGILLILSLLLLMAPDAVAYDRPGPANGSPRPAGASPAQLRARAERFNNQGVDFYQLRRYQEALKQYNEAVRLNPQYVEAYANRGATFDALNNPTRAVQDYSTAIQLKPSLTYAYRNRAAAYCDLGRFQSALADWNLVIRRTPRDASAYNARALCYQSLKNWPGAAADFDQALKLDPGYRKAAANKRKMLQQMTAAASAAAKKPSHPVKPPPAQIAQHPVPSAAKCLPTPQPSPPAEATQPLLRIFNPFHHVLGNLYFAFGCDGASAQSFSRAIKSDPGDYFAYFRRARACAAAGQLQQAADDYEQASRLSPHFRQARLRRDRLRKMAAYPIFRPEVPAP
jgi:tetratricopeptide (TPR) repeat protein